MVLHTSGESEDLHVAHAVRHKTTIRQSMRFMGFLSVDCACGF